MKKIAFVTGGTGFLGRNLIDELLRENWEVTALHRKTSNLASLKLLGIHLREGDLQNLSSLGKIIPQKADAVFHVAANVSAWPLEREAQYKDNVLGTRNMVEASLKNGVKRFIFTSTMATYGFHQVPLTEESESKGLESGLQYVRTKRLAELEVQKGVEKGLDAVILQPCLIFGPYDVEQYSQIFMQIKENKLPGVPPGGIHFCHAREVSRAHLRAFEKGRCGHSYILGGPYASYLKAFQKIAGIVEGKLPQKVTPLFILYSVAYFSLWGSYITRKPPALLPQLVKLLAHRWESCSQKAEKELGYHAIPLEESFRDCYQWMISGGSDEVKHLFLKRAA